MNPFFNSMRPWWVGFIVTWILIAFGLRINGMEGDVAVRWAFAGAALVALAIWLTLRSVGRTGRD